MVSVRDFIVLNMTAALNTISVANGYNSNLNTASGGGGAQKPGAVENPLAVLPVVIVSAPAEDKDEDTSRHSYIRNRLRVELELVPDQDGTGPVEDQIDNLVEDVERVLLGENQNDPPLSTTGVEEIRLDGHTKLPVEGESLDGALMSMTVIYRHNVDDPRTYSP